jgi:hopanoid biosynthesis associated RND transporter like protein HpnN
VKGFSDRKRDKDREGALARWLERWVDVVQSRPRRTLSICVVTAVVSIVYAALTLHLSTRRTDLLRPDHPVVQDYQRLRNEFDRESDMIVVAAGSSPADLAAALDKVAVKLRARPDLFEKVLDRIDVSALRAKGLFQLPVERLRQLERSLAPLALASLPPVDSFVKLIGWRPITLENGLRGPENEALLRSLDRFLALGQYRSPFPDAPADDAGALFDDPETSGYVFSPDKRLAILRVLPVRDPTSFVGLGAPVAELRRIVAKVAADHDAVELGLTGLPILEDDEMQTATSSGAWAAGLEIVGVTLVFIVGFRALRHPLLIQLALVVAACWTLGMVAMTVGRLNILSMTFIVTLIGMGVDFGVVWLTRFESARSAGSDPPSSNRRAATEIGPGIVSGAVTTTVAFYATTVTDFVGLRDMGWIAGTGILVCLFSMLTVLPAALAMWSRPDIVAARRGRRDLAPAFGRAAARPRTVLALGSAATLSLAACIPWLRSDFNLLNLQATGLPSVEWEHRLMREMKASGWSMLLSVGTVDEARTLKARLEALPQVGRIVDAATLLPVDQDAKRPIIARLRRWLPRSPAVNDSTTGFDVESVRHSMHALARRANDHHDAAALILDRMKALEPAELAARLNRFQSLWTADLAGRLAELKASSDPNPVVVEDLPPALLARYRGKSGRWLLQVFPKDAAWDPEPLDAFVTAVRTVDPHAAGEPATSLLGVVELVQGFKRSSWLAALAVFAACLIDLRSLRLAALAMTPLLAGCAAAFGSLALVGMTINPANLIALPLILGLGVDFGVHVLHDYSRSPAGYVLDWRLARALLLTTATTIVGFSSLMVSGHHGMIGIGVLLSLGVAWCSAAALFLLPAILHLLPATDSAAAVTLAFPAAERDKSPLRQAA